VNDLRGKQKNKLSESVELLKNVAQVTCDCGAGPCCYSGNDIPDSPSECVIVFGDGFAQPAGCKIIAGGRRPPESEEKIISTLKGVRDITNRVGGRAGTLSGCNLIDSLTGGLRCARPPVTL
jgi:hypothetical protein